VLVALEEAGIKAQVFSDVEPDPTIDVVMDGVARLRESRADAVLAVGGGSPIDAAKAMIACSAKGCSPEALNGYFRVRNFLSMLLAALIRTRCWFVVPFGVVWDVWQSIGTCSPGKRERTRLGAC